MSPSRGSAHTIGMIVLMLWLSWLGMMLVHELGHVVGAWMTGGRVERVVWHPLALSRTDVSPNPTPLVVASAVPAMGIMLPLLASLALRRTQLRPYAAFFAGFCLIANGVYLGVGWIDRVGDAGELLRLGAPRWSLIAFGVLATAAGLGIWHRTRLNNAKSRTWWWLGVAGVATLAAFLVGRTG
jgi:hypothetical protein